MKSPAFFSPLTSHSLFFFKNFLFFGYFVFAPLDLFIFFSFIAIKMTDDGDLMQGNRDGESLVKETKNKKGANSSIHNC